MRGEVRALACRRQTGTEPEGAVPEGGYQTVASSPSVSQSPELISADRPQGPTGMSVEVGSPTIPVLPSPTSASTPAARSKPGSSVCTPPLKCLVTDPRSVYQMDSGTLILPELHLPQRRLRSRQSLPRLPPLRQHLRYDSNRRDRTRTRFSSQSLMGKGTFGRT